MIRTENLQENMVLAEDVFATPGSATPLVRSGCPLTGSLIAHIGRSGIHQVRVRKDPPRQPAADGVFPSARPAPLLEKELRSTALDSLEDMFNIASIRREDIHDSSARVLGRIDRVVSRLVASLLSRQDTLVNIGDLKSYDDYTYHHSLSVAVLSLGIGQHLGYRGEELNRLGVCAMMHDIGKTAIPLEIIQKPARLDRREFSLVQTHAQAGYQYLSHTALRDPELWRGVLHHHEKVDGTGYPLGLKGRDIPEWSRIIAVADVYDALTSNRPYRQPIQPADAIEYIMGGCGTAFDFDIVAALMDKIDLYPLGCEVELSDHRRARVVDNTHQMRPVVRVIESDEVLDLFGDRQCLSLVINRVARMPAG